MKILLLLLAGTLPASGQVIEGSVLNSKTFAPVGGVSVTITAKGRVAYQTTTDLQGAFHIDGVKPGSYTANFSHSAFIGSEPGDPALRPFTVTSDPVRLEVKLKPLGKVGGRVVDANGDPVASADVSLDGSRMGDTATTDKDGNFSFQVAPGRYLLMAKPPMQLKHPDGEKERMGWAPTYYPGVLDSRDAVKLQLAAGAEVWGNDIKLRTVTLRQVRGVVLDAKGDPVPRVFVNAARTDDLLGEDLSTVSGDDGTFELTSLYAGEWSIFAEKESNGIKLKGFAGLVIGDRDVDGVELRLKAPFSIGGTVTINGSNRITGKLNLYIRPSVIAGSQGQSAAVVDSNGSFRIDNVYPGNYKMIALTPGPPYFLASIKMGNRDLIGQDVEFYPGAGAIQVAFESKGGSVKGMVAECGDATVVLVPADNALRQAQFFRTTSCAEGGRFELGNVRPGDYLVFALNRWESASDLISGMNQTLLNNAVNVRIVNGESATADLRVTTREP
jgi:hypothetical protein